MKTPLPLIVIAVVEAELTETLHFDLSPLQELYEQGYQTSSGSIILMLDKATEAIEFIF